MECLPPAGASSWPIVFDHCLILLMWFTYVTDFLKMCSGADHYAVLAQATLPLAQQLRVVARQFHLFPGISIA